MPTRRRVFLILRERPVRLWTFANTTSPPCIRGAVGNLAQRVDPGKVHERDALERYHHPGPALQVGQQLFEQPVGSGEHQRTPQVVDHHVVTVLVEHGLLLQTPHAFEIAWSLHFRAGGRPALGAPWTVTN